MFASRGLRWTLSGKVRGGAFRGNEVVLCLESRLGYTGVCISENVWLVHLRYKSKMVYMLYISWVYRIAIKPLVFDKLNV